MTPEQTVLNRLNTQMARIHPRWHALTFVRQWWFPVQRTVQRRLGLTADDPLFVALAEVGCNALIEGVIGPGAAQSFLEKLLTQLIPAGLAEVPSHRRLACLAEAWNLGDALRHQPGWIDAYLRTTVDAINLDALGPAITQVLSPLFTPSHTATWTGALRHTATLDLSAQAPSFVPEGPPMLLAPTVMALRDRNGAGDLAVFLRRDGESAIFGPMTRQPEVRCDVPRARIRAGRLEIGTQRLDLPLVGALADVALSPAGFAVIAAGDAQRVWVVESR